MAKKRAPGGGRKREIGEEPGQVTPVRFGEQHLAELDAIVADGKARNRSEAVRLLIEQSAERRNDTTPG